MNDSVEWKVRYASRLWRRPCTVCVLWVQSADVADTFEIDGSEVRVRCGVVWCM